MNARIRHSGVAVLLTIFTVAAVADTQWLPSPAILKEHMSSSQSVVIARLTDVSVERRSRTRSGSGRIAVVQIVVGAGRVLPTIRWSDRNEVACPRLNLDQFKDRLGVWFVHIDASGAFDSYRSEFWELATAKGILEQIEESESLSPELRALRRAIELSIHAPVAQLQAAPDRNPQSLSLLHAFRRRSEPRSLVRAALAIRIGVRILD